MNKASAQQSLFEPGGEGLDVEVYEFQRDVVTRAVTTRSGAKRYSAIGRNSLNDSDAWAAFDQSWLRSRTRPTVQCPQGNIRVVDLFAGCGALSLGIAEAARALQLDFEPLLAVDTNAAALAIFDRNLKPQEITNKPAELLLDGEIGAPPTMCELQLQDRLGPVDILVGGPPCQGHSDLNNHTRRADPKNDLYLRMARFAEVISPKHIIIENVPGAIHDQSRVVQRTRAILQRLGYDVESLVLMASALGVAQRRKRLFTIASRIVPVSLDRLKTSYNCSERDFSWACGDLTGRGQDTIFDSPSPASDLNRARIDYLFANGIYELPDEMRPPCHRDKAHTYRAVYGRLRADEPANTVTSGFGSMGQGRYVHPHERRTITPHEAARLQFIPDFFDLAGTARHALQEIIGNAVPPKFAYVIALDLLR